MSVSKIATVWCDGVDCYEWADVGPVPATPYADVARKAARAHGWRYVNGVDLCPKCIAARKVAE